MRTILKVFIAVLFVVGLNVAIVIAERPTKKPILEYTQTTIDGCEYIVSPDWSLCHKGNCTNHSRVVDREYHSSPYTLEIKTLPFIYRGSGIIMTNIINSNSFRTYTNSDIYFN